MNYKRFVEALYNFHDIRACINLYDDDDVDVDDIYA